MKASLSLLAVLSLCLLACGGPKWVVVKQASPNPMAPSTRFTVAGAELAPDFRIGARTEAEWMAEKKDETRERWAGDKVALGDKFVEGFMSDKDPLIVENAAGAGIVLVRARYTNYSPGHYAVVSSSPAVLEATIEFLDEGGSVIDEIRIQTKSHGFSAGQGARACAHEIGQVAARYLHQRVGR